MPPLATVKSLSQRGELVWLSYVAEIPIAKVDFNYTTDRGKWKDRHWTTVAVESEGQHKTRATLPPGVTAYYFNLTDEHGLVVSSDLRFVAGAIFDRMVPRGGHWPLGQRCGSIRVR